jgi:competence protein ComEA
MGISRDRIAWLFVGLFIGIIVAAVGITLIRNTRPTTIYITPPSPTQTLLPSPTAAPIRIHVSGEVAHPDVYELPVYAIVRDAVTAAGGLTGEADIDRVNLALPLSDGMRIHVPALDEEPQLPLVSGDSPSVDAPSKGDTSPLGDVPSPGIINLNLATLDELETLPGIGPTLGQRIIDYRQANGPFANTEDLMEISGIGPGKYEQIKDLVSIQ